MTEIIAVRFKAGGKQYYFDPQGLQVPQGTGVIVETGKGLEYGVCSRPNAMVRDDVVVQPLRPVVRIATAKDEKQVKDNHRKEKDAMKVCQQLVERHGLDMKLVEVEYSFDGSKIIFFFTSEGRVDFRALVKDLASIFRSRIELRQIGVRDEARMLGGLGICGKPFCCHQFLDEFQPVSIKMAKTQNLSLNPTKISGTCGRLMCCLKYEQEAYEDAVKRCPKQDSFVECPDGVGNVTAVNLLREQVKVRLEDSTEQPKTYRTTEIRVVRNGKGKRPEDYVAPPKEELEKLRYIPPEEERSLGDTASLAALLEQYMAVNQQAEEEKKSASRNRRRRGGGKKEAQPDKPKQAPVAPAASDKPKAKSGSSGSGFKRPSRGPKPQQGQPKGGAQKPQQPKQPTQPPKQTQPGPKQGQETGAGGEKRRRSRPHHRRKKPQGEGGGAAN